MLLVLFGACQHALALIIDLYACDPPMNANVTVNSPGTYAVSPDYAKCSLPLGTEPMVSPTLSLSPAVRACMHVAGLQDMVRVSWNM